jgi:ElaB/YqjD/DUF883 family membrane-anchored ribosome-binding protein
MTEATTRRLIQELRAAMKDVEDLVAATAGDLGERAKEARQKASESAGKAQAGLEELEGQLAARAKAIAEDATDYVRENPWQSIGIAAAIGMVAGLLLSRR